MAGEKFESAVKKLEAIVEELESGNIALDATLKRYEEGVKLAALCTSILNKAEKRIEVLSKNELGEFETTPFEEDDEVEATPRKRTRKKKED
ncbi:exodeoxyribonuclease VII small subunit [Candidatus Omnitrophota bacterium]